MLKLQYTNKFEKDLKRVQKQGNKKGIKECELVISKLQNGETLDSKYKDHKLNKNEFVEEGSRCCHLLFDLLFVYVIKDNVLVCSQIGDHHSLKGFKESFNESIESIDLTKYIDKDGHCELPNSVTSIGDRAFSNCQNLKTIKIPDTVTSIGNDAFSNCTSLTSITIPDSVTSIEEWAFFNCTRLTNITIGNSVTSIEKYAFSGCTSLASITIPNSVTSIAYDAFYNCQNLKTITIPDSVTSIEDNLFEECTSLTSITIPNSVTNIGDYTFSKCTSLTSITIPDSVTSIGKFAFESCTGLTSITIPDSVTSIGKFAFESCTGLTSITIPNSVTSIEDNLFEECTSLTSITIPNSVTSIGKYAFSNCTSLTSITIPDSVTSIGKFAFSCDTSLSVVVIGNNVKKIDRYMFEGCENLYLIVCNSETIIDELMNEYPNLNIVFGFPDTQTYTLEESKKKQVSKEQVLNLLDKTFGQKELYMWSTYVLPNGHFLNSDNPNANEYWDEQDCSPDYEHSDFIYFDYNSYGETVFDDCVKMNVTYPYLILPKKLTIEQQNAIKEIIRNSNGALGFIYGGDYNEWLGKELPRDVKKPLLLDAPFGTAVVDLAEVDEYSLIKLINKAYIQGFIDKDVDGLYEGLKEDKLNETPYRGTDIDFDKSKNSIGVFLSTRKGMALNYSNKNVDDKYPLYKYSISKDANIKTLNNSRSTFKSQQLYNKFDYSDLENISGVDKFLYDDCKEDINNLIKSLRECKSKNEIDKAIDEFIDNNGYTLYERLCQCFVYLNYHNNYDGVKYIEEESEDSQYQIWNLNVLTHKNTLNLSDDEYDNLLEDLLQEVDSEGNQITNKTPSNSDNINEDIDIGELNDKFAKKEIDAETYMSQLRKYFDEQREHNKNTSKRSSPIFLYRGTSERSFSKNHKPVSGLFFGVKKENVTGWGSVKRYTLDKIAKIYEGDSSDDYCIKNNLYDKEYPEFKEFFGMYGDFTKLNQFVNSTQQQKDEINKNVEEYAGKQFCWYDYWTWCLQLATKLDLESKGYDGAKWEHEDFGNSIQYQIWNLNKVKSSDEVVEDYLTEGGQEHKFDNDIHTDIEWDEYGGHLICWQGDEWIDNNDKIIEDNLRGMIDFDIDEDKHIIYIGMIQTSIQHRREGIATLMMNDLQKRYQGNKLNLGFTTNDGTKFFNNYLKNNNVKTIKDDINENDNEKNLAQSKSKLKSAGIYSIKKNKWIKKPILADIPKIDKEELDKQFKVWEDRFFEIQENPTVESIDKYLDDIYAIRQEGIEESGEYNLKNLCFKEARNLGFLDTLKELKDELVSKELSLESLNESDKDYFGAIVTTAFCKFLDSIDRGAFYKRVDDNKVVIKAQYAKTSITITFENDGVIDVDAYLEPIRSHSSDIYEKGNGCHQFFSYQDFVNFIYDNLECTWITSSYFNSKDVDRKEYLDLFSKLYNDNEFKSNEVYFKLDENMKLIEGARNFRSSDVFSDFILNCYDDYYAKEEFNQDVIDKYRDEHPDDDNDEDEILDNDDIIDILFGGNDTNEYYEAFGDWIEERCPHSMDYEEGQDYLDSAVEWLKKEFNKVDIKYSENSDVDIDDEMIDYYRDYGASFEDIANGISWEPGYYEGAQIVFNNGDDEGYISELCNLYGFNIVGYTFEDIFNRFKQEFPYWKDVDTNIKELPKPKVDTFSLDDVESE